MVPGRRRRYAPPPRDLFAGDVENDDDDDGTIDPDGQLERDPNMRFAPIASYHDSVIVGVFLGLGSGEYEQAMTSALAKLAGRHPDRCHRFSFDSSLHTAVSSDSTAPGIPGLTASYDERRR